MANVKVNWKENLSFEGISGDYKFNLDASFEHGGNDNGARPKELMLIALAGCTGMDVVSLLNKMREKIDGFSMSVEADLAEDHPKVYTRFAIEYNLKGVNLNVEKVIKSVTMSQEKYCGVAAMLRMIAPLTYKVFLNDIEILSD